ncbi:MAG TPA: LamG domain-containing protein, partial [Saprospiraceae bacterium]|nr:LamG domain-containing protein [Saprospiraceae bacterium]
NGNGNAQGSGIIHQDLSNTFPSGSFNASKGYDPDKVVLEWNNNNGNLINTIRIYRRILESGDNYALLFTLNSGSGIYNDLYAEAGTLYEYLIFAESQCENFIIYSDSTTSIGFRRKQGTVTGQVTYSGGTAVEDVKISAESTTGIYGRSLSFPGGSDQISIPDDAGLHVDSTFLFEAWIRPASYAGNFKIAEKSGSYIFEYNQLLNQYQVRFYKNASTWVQEVFATSDLPLNNYSHLAIQIHNRHIQIFVNGNMIKDKVMTPDFPGEIDIIDSSAPLTIGKFFTGLIDEIRIWNQSKTPEQIQRDYSRILIGTEPGLKVYLNTNEGVGRYAYDASKSGTLFNKHHAAFEGSINWSMVIPTTSQLSVANYTNASGNYTLVIPYNSAGEVFELTPSFTVHEFEPSVTALFIGDGAPIHNNINFVDRSSFRVTGAVNFKNTTCGVPDAFLKVDGEILVVEGNPAKTDATGAFDIQVPIGMHHLEVEQAGHVYSVGRFPATGKYDFQEDLAGVNFSDSTLVSVVGRVVGGLREGSKTPGLGLSKNNIGIAHITLTSQQGNGCSMVTIETDPLTGEYSLLLPPLKYVPTVNIPSNPTIDFGVLDLVDLSGTPILKTAFDTIFDIDGEVVSIDSVHFHRQLDYIYRVNPIIAVFDRDGVSPFIGDSIYTYEDATGMMQTRNLRTDPFRWPVFTERDGGAYLYRCMIRVFEPYVNFQTSAIDSVPTTDGILRVDNEFADVPHAELQLKDINTLDSLKS